MLHSWLTTQAMAGSISVMGCSSGLPSELRTLSIVWAQAQILLGNIVKLSRVLGAPRSLEATLPCI